jgi:hypothetical protein
VESLACFRTRLGAPVAFHPVRNRHGRCKRVVICRIVADQECRVTIAVAATGGCGEALAHVTQIQHGFLFRPARRPSLAMLAGKHTHTLARAHQRIFGFVHACLRACESESIFAGLH